MYVLVLEINISWEVSYTHLKHMFLLTVIKIVHKYGISLNPECLKFILNRQVFEKNDFSIVIALLFMVNYINIIFFRNR